MRHVSSVGGAFGLIPKGCEFKSVRSHVFFPSRTQKLKFTLSPSTQVKVSSWPPKTALSLPLNNYIHAYEATMCHQISLPLVRGSKYVRCCKALGAYFCFTKGVVSCNYTRKTHGVVLSGTNSIKWIDQYFDYFISDKRDRETDRKIEIGSM